jgi:hypothetical protein
MARYFFHTQDGHCVRDPEGVELPDLEAAKAEATQVLAETLRRSPSALWNTGHFSVVVTDQTGLTLLVVDADGALAPAAPLPPIVRGRRG